MKPSSRSSWALGSALSAFILVLGLPAIAQVDRATGLEGAAALQGSVDEALDARATGIGMKQEAPVQSTEEVPDKPTRTVRRSGVSVGSASDEERQEALTPRATGIGR